MVDYKNACVYKICCKDPNIKDVYIGSTCNLIRRRAEHKRKCYDKNGNAFNYPVYRFIRDHGGWCNWIVLKIKDTPCDNVDELRLKEREEFEKIGATLNSRYPQRSKKEYQEGNKEHLKEKKKEYYDKNKEEILEKKKEYYDEKKEEILGYKKEYYDEKKEEILEKRKEKVECPCGSIVRKSDLARHKKSLKHQNYLKSLEENKISLV